MSIIGRKTKAMAAKLTGVPEDNLKISDIEAGIQACIDAAWDSQDPAHRELQQTLFPTGKPTPEQFIAVVSSVIREDILIRQALSTKEMDATGVL